MTDKVVDLNERWDLIEKGIIPIGCEVLLRILRVSKCEQRFTSEASSYLGYWLALSKRDRLARSFHLFTRNESLASATDSIHTSYCERLATIYNIYIYIQHSRVVNHRVGR